MAESIYLKRSPKTGQYSYRRRIPQHLQEIAGKREFRISLKTKIRSVAMLKCAQTNLAVDAQLAAYEIQASGGQATTPNEALTAATALLQAHDIHPDQMPTLKANATPEERDAFDKARFDWLMSQEWFSDVFLRSQEISTDPKTGEIEYKANDPRDVMQAAEAIASGATSTNLEPTFRDGLENYLEVQKAKGRDADAWKKFENDVRRVADEFASSVVGKGYDTPLRDFTRIDARGYFNYLQSLDRGLSPSSAGREITPLSAIFNTAATEYADFADGITNPFKGLRNMKRERKTSDDRRSFKPEELARYETALRALKNQAIGMIGLIMVYTGCRTNEAAGLEVRDIVLDSNVPHIKFRANSLRDVSKDGLARSVPLPTPLLDALRDYPRPDEPKAPAFGKYAPRKSWGNVSAQQSKIIRRELKISDSALVPYSTRHTFKDRATAARVAPEIYDYLRGHSTRFSSIISERYGTGTPPSTYVEDMARILATEDWGEFD